jgi:hypothetical protein
LTTTTLYTRGNERSFVRKDEDNGRIKGKKRAKNGSPMIDKRLRRKRRKNLSKLLKRTLGSLQVRTQHLGA